MKKQTRSRSPITSHVLDLVSGSAAKGIAVFLWLKQGTAWKPIAKAVTNQDGRVDSLLPLDHDLKAGIYKIDFDLNRYDKKSFYPMASIQFKVIKESDHYHIPLLYSKNGFSTYRGT